MIQLAAMAADVCIDMVVPYKVWSELEYQSKSGNRDIAFAARSVIRMLRETLEANIAATDGSEKRTVLRSQTLVESRDAAAKFLPKDFPQSTNDDHILACAMWENERARRESPASRRVEVVLATQDNNLACKAYSNGLRVDILSAIREKYRQGSLRQSGDNAPTAPSSINGKAELIELLSDSSDDEVEIIDLTNVGSPAKNPKSQTTSGPTASATSPFVAATGSAKFGTAPAPSPFGSTSLSPSTSGAAPAPSPFGRSGGDAGNK